MAKLRRPRYPQEIIDYAYTLACAAHFEGGKYDTTEEILSRYPQLTYEQAHDLWADSMFEAMW